VGYRRRRPGRRRRPAAQARRGAVRARPGPVPGDRRAAARGRRPVAGPPGRPRPAVPVRRRGLGGAPGRRGRYPARPPPHRDAARWVLDDLRRRGIAPRLVLFAGAAFGRIRGVPGADAPLLVPEASRSVAVSVGAEPAGVPAGVTVLGGGPARFLALLADQLERRRRGDV